MRSIYDKHNIYVSTPDWFKDADLTQSSQKSGAVQSTSGGMFVSSSTDFESIPIDNQTIVWENELLHVPIDNDKLIIKDGKLTIFTPSPEEEEPTDNDYVTIKGDQNIKGLKTFEKGIKIGEYALSNPQTDVVYLDANLVVRGGIVMYALGSDIDVPSIYEGLPIDDNTLKWVDTISDDGTVISVLSVNPEIDLGGASTWGELEGKPTWITVTKPRWDYEKDIDNKPDLSIYATLDYVNNTFVTIGPPYLEITGEKNFKGGLKVNDGEIIYNSANKYWKLDGDLLITGGITMYGNDSDFKPSTVMDGILYDPSTLAINDKGQLYVKGSTGGGGGITEVYWEDIKNKPDLSVYIKSADLMNNINVDGTTISKNSNNQLYVKKENIVKVVTALPAASNRTTNTLYIIVG